MSTPKPGRVLVVDDEIELMIALVETLNRQGYAAIGRTSGDEALAALKAEAFDVLLTDLMMPGMDGIALLRAGLEVDPHLVGLIMTGQGTVQTAVEALKSGAFDYVLKPFKTQMLLPALERALEVRRVRLENVQLRETVAINELSQAIAITLDLNALLNKTAEAARQQMGADEVSILLHARDDPELYLAAVRGANREALLGQRVPLEGSIAGWVARHREPLILHGQVNDPRFAPLRSRSDIHSAISVPMLSAGHAVGVLNVSRLRLYRPFTPGQAKALSILANTAAAAVENAQLHAQVQTSERRFRALVENGSDEISILAADGALLYESPSANPTLGYRPGESLGQSLFHLIHPDDVERIQSRFAQLMQKPDLRPCEQFRLRHHDGTWRWVEAVGANLLAEPSVRGIVINYHDITERKQAEENLRRSELEFRSLTENIPDIVARFDRQLRHIYTNNIVGVKTGRPAQAFIGKTNRELGMPEHLVAFWDESLNQVFESAQPRTIEFEFTSPDGLRFFESRLVPEFGPTGGVARVLSIARDITERKRAEEALREAEQKYRNIFENSVDGIYQTTSDGRYITANPALARMYGYDSTEELLASVTDLNRQFYVDPGRRAEFERQLEARDSISGFESEIYRKDGGTMWVSENARVVRDHRGALLYYEGTTENITERKRAEVEIERRLAELEAVNRVSTALRAAQTLDEMLPLLLSETIAVLQAQRGSIWLYEPRSDELRVAVQQGWGEAPVPPLRRDQGIPGQVFATGQAYLSRDFKSDPLTPDAVRARIPEGVAGACVPIRTTADVIGVMFVRVEQPRELAADEVRLLTTLAEIAGNAIHRMSLHEQTERRLQHLAALRVVDQAITASLDLRLTLNALLDQVTTQLRVDAADVLLLNPHLLTLEYAAGRGFRRGSPPRLRLRLGESQAGRAALERRTIILPTIPWDERPFIHANLIASENFQAYCGVPLLAKGQVKGVLEVFHRVPLEPDDEWLNFLETLSGQAAIAVDNAELFDHLQRSNAELTLAYDATIEGWSRALDLRDKETEGHTQRVTELTLELAHRMGLTEEERVHVRRGALLHDIGKMGVPDAILLKPGQLTAEEWEIMRKHPTYAYEMLAPIVYLRPALDIPHYHHEKWDGTGYPHGLKGEQIPLAARLFAVVDVWDALRSDRPYRQAWPEDRVRAHIQSLAGTHFDPQVAEAFIRLIAAESTQAS